MGNKTSIRIQKHLTQEVRRGDTGDSGKGGWEGPQCGCPGSDLPMWWYGELRLTAETHCDNLHNCKNEILEINKLIQWLQQDIENVKAQMRPSQDNPPSGLGHDGGGGPSSLGAQLRRE